jgi:hypothetical protein
MLTTLMWFVATVPFAIMCLLAEEVKANEWILMPDGREYHESCVHHHETNFDIEQTLEPCPYQSRSGNLGYYSDWSVYAKAVEVQDHFSSLTATWTVPQAPSSSGPAGMSSIYYFPGLEDGSGVHGNATFILQPVLQYGKSGCVIDPLLWHQWHLSAYLVDGNGRAHCGPRLKVSPGEQVLGRIDQDQDTWTVKAVRLKTNETSTYSTKTLNEKVVDAAYMTLEGMIIYGCDAFPSGGGITFTDISAKSGKAGLNVDLKWQGVIRHSECKQKVDLLSDGDVRLEYTN